MKIFLELVHKICRERVNVSFKPAVQYIHAWEPRQTSWIYAERAEGKRDGIQEIHSPPASNTANTGKSKFWRNRPFKCRLFCML